MWTYLKYKLEEQGKKLVKVDKFLRAVRFAVPAATKTQRLKILLLERGIVLNVALITIEM